MKKFLCHLLLLTTLCTVLSTCRHDPEADPTPCDCGQVTTIDELREWAFFKEGTYWIYEEETTLTRDTFTVVDSHDFITTQGNVQFDYGTYRSSDGYFYWFWFNEGWTAHDCNNGCCDCRRLWCDKYISGDADGEDVLLTFPTFVGSYSGISFGGGDNGKVEVVDYMEELQVGATTFLDVVEENNENSVLDQQTSSSNYYQVNYYFSRSVGIIRKEIEKHRKSGI